MAGLTGGPACSSCGSPMMSARDHGGGKESNPYCRVCTDARGVLLPYEKVVTAFAEQRFMKVNGMPRAGAEESARKALEHMPAWKGKHG
ncbi:MAG: zinc ribbon domain-containing protein [Deltaproteobacteria bacterium]